MASVALYNMEGAQVGTIELSDSIFAVPVNEHLIHQAVVAQLANKRQGTQKAKTRAEVSGGGRKPWRQKGTGHARQGSIRAPQWRHGGIALGPKPRDYRYTLNKKVRKLAILSALSSKVLDKDLIVVDKISFEEIKTKKMVEMLKALGADKKALIVMPAVDEAVIKSAANIPGVTTALYNTINTYDILNHDKLILAKDAALKIEEVYDK